MWNYAVRRSSGNAWVITHSHSFASAPAAERAATIAVKELGLDKPKERRPWEEPDPCIFEVAIFEVEKCQVGTPGWETQIESSYTL